LVPTEGVEPPILAAAGSKPAVYTVPPRRLASCGPLAALLGPVDPATVHVASVAVVRPDATVKAPVVRRFQVPSIADGAEVAFPRRKPALRAQYILATPPALQTVPLLARAVPADPEPHLRAVGLATQIREYQGGVPFELVPSTGLEPAIPCGNQPLRLTCIPFHHEGLRIGALREIRTPTPFGTRP
jgi:hypothetical protein